MPDPCSCSFSCSGVPVNNGNVKQEKWQEWDAIRTGFRGDWRG